LMGPDEKSNDERQGAPSDLAPTKHDDDRHEALTAVTRNAHVATSFEHTASLNRVCARGLRALTKGVRAGA
jgi:hypothetical protein